MGTVERDRIEYVGAEGARAMFDFTITWAHVGKAKAAGSNVNIMLNMMWPEHLTVSVTSEGPTFRQD